LPASSIFGAGDALEHQRNLEALLDALDQLQSCSAEG
jgi:hypothetical protein